MNLRCSTRVFIATGLLLAQLSCASYSLGTARRSLPGGYDRVSIPLFHNSTLEPGLEPLFTTALIEEIERNQVTKVVPSEEAQVVLNGAILKIQYVRGAKTVVDKTSSSPNRSELAGDYRILIETGLELVRRSDGKILWTGNFKGERGYSTPQLKIAGTESANAPYNQSARLHFIQLLAQDLMVQAHSNMTESF